ncbi:hypothetical protein VE02_09471 [Pseudogymnoascus sp. 03VT05]|nr:hypothetical protein VE02_09471 [Pseudogymnoascus sp. 03VT05]
MSRNLDEPSPMSRAARNVFIYNHDGHIVGGLFQNGSILNSNLYEMCGVFIVTNGQFCLFRLNGDGSRGARLFSTRTTLSTGRYIVLSTDGNPISVDITEECAPRRVTTKDPSSKITGRTKSFHDRVIARDDECVMSGAKRTSYVDAKLFNVAHIFPFAREQTWVDQGMSRWITDTETPQVQGETKIHSVQNGLLMKADIHALFDGYGVAVNVDYGYKIVCLGPDPINIDGRTLSLCCRDPRVPERVPDELLRWHHRQAVLATMKGAGEKPWDMHFPDGTDIMAEIMEGPDAAERMEAEMFTRLGAGELHYSTSPEVGSP